MHRELELFLRRGERRRHHRHAIVQASGELREPRLAFLQARRERFAVRGRLKAVAAAAGEPHPRLEHVALLLERLPVGVERSEPPCDPLGDELERTPLEITREGLRGRARRRHVVVGEAHARPRHLALDHLALQRLRKYARLLPRHPENREPLVAPGVEVLAHPGAAGENLPDVARAGEERPQPRLG